MILNKTRKTVVCRKAVVSRSVLSHIKGLMFTFIPPDTGFLMVFPKSAKTGIWTFGMMYAIDVAWLDSKGRIVDVKENFLPWRLPRYPREKAKMILEVRAGIFKKSKTQVGDVLEINDR